MNDRGGNAATECAESGQGTDGSVVRFYELGIDHMRAGRFLEVQRSCEQALALAPDHADTLHLVGLLCVHTKQLDRAVEWLFRAIRREPKLLYLTTLGTAFLQQGRGANALQALERAIEIEPDNAQLWSNLGLAQLRRNDEAILSFRHALKLEPGLWNAASKVGSQAEPTGAAGGLVIDNRVPQLVRAMATYLIQQVIPALTILRQAPHLFRTTLICKIQPP